MVLDPRFFKHSNDFVPERWTTSPELNIRPDVFVPFFAGPYACPGKQLGLMELRQVLASMVMQFDFEFASKDYQREFQTGTKDYFGIEFHSLNMVFTSRHTA